MNNSDREEIRLMIREELAKIELEKKFDYSHKVDEMLEYEVPSGPYKLNKQLQERLDRDVIGEDIIKQVFAERDIEMDAQKRMKK